MSSVKLPNKEQLDELAALILLKTHQKLSQQDLLALCVQFAANNLESFASLISRGARQLSDKEIEKIEEFIIEDWGEGTEDTSERVDEFVYGD